MEQNSNTNESSRTERQNVSFKFTKKVSKAATGNKLEESKSSSQKEHITYVNENKIKSSASKDEEKDLIIPLIKKNNWRVPTSVENGSQDSESKLKELAVLELLQESKEKNEQWDNRDYKNDAITVPLIMQNKVPEGFETDEKMDVSLRPDESNLDDYEKVPIERFGLAMLRGMGWKEGDPVGANCKQAAEPIQVEPRPKGLGLGADTSALNKAKDKKGDEKLKLAAGAYVVITQGSNKGFYGEVLGLDEENARVIVKLSENEKPGTFPEFSVEVVSKKVYEKERKVINRATYEKIKKELEEKERWAREDSKEKKISRDEKKRSYDSSMDPDSNPREGHSKKREKSLERSSENSRSDNHKSSKPWVRPQLRVRLIDDRYKKGKYFNEKVIVIDVLSPRNCTCKTDSGKYLEDISPSMLETVIPRTDPSYVMIVQGKYAGELCTILERNKSKCLATVQFLSDRHQALEIDYDSICEYVGDVSEYD